MQPCAPHSLGRTQVHTNITTGPRARRADSDGNGQTALLPCLLALAAGLLDRLDRGSVGLGARGVASELLKEAGGSLEGARELALGLGAPEVELDLVRLEGALDGGEGLDKELGVCEWSL